MQNLFASLTKSTAKLPSTSDTPQLQRSQSSIVSSSPSSSFLRITGNYTFYLSPELSPKDPLTLTQSLVLTLNAFTESTRKYAIAFSCKWFRLINEKAILLPINSNTFVFSAFDIGSTFKCEVKSEEEDFKGVAILTVGPVNCDEALRSDVEHILEAEKSKYLVRLVNEAKDLVGKEKFFLLMTKEMMKLMGQNSNNSFLDLQYAIGNPEMEVDFNDPLRISLIFRPDSPDFEKLRGFLGLKEGKEPEKLRLGVLFENKPLRDVFLMVYRLFSAKKYLIANRLFEEFSSLEKFNNIKGLPAKGLDLLLEIENLKRRNEQVLAENREMALETSKISDRSAKLREKEQQQPQQKLIEEKRALEKRVYELESQMKDLQNPNKLFQEFDMKQSFLSDISVIEKFAKEDNVTARDMDYQQEIEGLRRTIGILEEEKRILSAKAAQGEAAVEFKMMNEMLKMEVNTYKAQRESQLKEISHLKELLEKNSRGSVGRSTAKTEEDIGKVKVINCKFL